MSDYIKREDAIKTLEGWKISGEMILGTVPSADVRENVRGHWELKTDRFGGLSDNVTAWANYCSVCGYHYGTPYNFCPNCGAEMRREDNGRDEENHNRV